MDGSALRALGVPSPSSGDHNDQSTEPPTRPKGSYTRPLPSNPVTHAEPPSKISSVRISREWGRLIYDTFVTILGRLCRQTATMYSGVPRGAKNKKARHFRADSMSFEAPARGFGVVGPGPLSHPRTATNLLNCDELVGQTLHAQVHCAPGYSAARRLPWLTIVVIS